MPPDQELAQLEQSISQVVALVQQMIESGEELSPEIEQALTQVIQSATSRISELQGAQIPQVQPTEPQGTQLLWQLANGNPDAFVSYLRNIPDRSLNQLLGNPQQLQRIIGDLSNKFPPGQPAQVGNIQQAPLNSSNIWGFNYDPQSGKMMVRFQGGSTYSYDGVPPYIFRIFQSGAIPAKTTGQNQYGKWWRGKQPSLGAAFYEMIKNGGFPYQRVA